jgi:hypothetical protein
VVAFEYFGKQVSITSDSGATWSTYSTTGITTSEFYPYIPSSSETSPYGGFFVDNSYSDDVIIYSADGINWSPVA